MNGSSHRLEYFLFGSRRISIRAKHISSLIEYFGTIDKKQKKPKESFLRGTWSQLSDLIS